MFSLNKYNQDLSHLSFQNNKAAEEKSKKDSINQALTILLKSEGHPGMIPTIPHKSNTTKFHVLSSAEDEEMEEFGEEIENLFNTYQKEIPADSPFSDTDLVIFADEYKGYVPINGIKEKDFLRISELFEKICSDKTNIKINGDREFVERIRQEIKKLLTRNIGRKTIEAVCNSKNGELIIRWGEECNSDSKTFIQINPDMDESPIEMHPSGKLKLGRPFLVAVVIGHEMLHWVHGEKDVNLPPTLGEFYDNMEEQVTITGFRNIMQNFESDAAEGFEPIQQEYDPLNERELTASFTGGENIYYPRFGHQGARKRKYGVKEYIETIVKNNIMFDLENLTAERTQEDKKERVVKNTHLKDKSMIFMGTQRGCNGVISIDKVEAIRCRLDHKCVPGITFNKNKIEGTIHGGTCSAMSLEFIDQFLKLKKSYTKDLTPLIKDLGTQLETSSERMRTRQAAFNTIEVTNTNLDASKNKIEALALYHGLQVKPSSKEIDIAKVNTSKDLEEINDLPNGTYIIRLIKPLNNEKLEEYGHTMVYIKEEGVNLLYDPNSGLKDLEGLDHKSVIFDEFKKNAERFALSKMRFYQVEQREEESDCEILREQEILGIDEALQEIAIEKENLECIKHFIDNDPLFLQKTMGGMPLFTYIVKNYHTKPRYEEMLNMLYEHKFDVNTVDSEGNSLLFYMGNNGDEISMKKFFAWNGNVHLKNKKGQTAVEFSFPKVEQSISVYKVLENNTREQELYAHQVEKYISKLYNLIKAVYNNPEDYIYENFKNSREGFNILENIFKFSKNISIGLVDHYIQNPEGINVQDSFGNSFLHHLASTGNMEGTKKVLGAGGDTQLTNEKGLKPGEFAFQEIKRRILNLKYAEMTGTMLREFKDQILDIADCINFVNPEFTIEEEAKDQLFDNLNDIDDEQFTQTLLNILQIKG